jgi:hypothetical protein
MRRLLGLLAGLLLSAPALASEYVRLDGSPGMLTVPTAGVLAPRSAAVGFGLQYSASPDQFRLDPIPIGLGVGIWDNLDLGVGVDFPIRRAEIREGARPTFLMRMRYRLLTQRRGRPAVAVELMSTGLFQRPGLMGALTTSIRRNKTHFGLAAGGGFDKIGEEFFPSLRVGLGVEVRAWSNGLVALESTYERRWFDPEAWGRVGIRAGLKAVAARPLAIVPWAGVEIGRGGILGVFGVSVSMTTMDLKVQDEDGDGLGDWLDDCPVEPEDEDSFEDFDGCADNDNDGDGIYDWEDETPNGEPPPAALEGDRALFQFRDPRTDPGPVRSFRELRDGQKRYFEGGNEDEDEPDSDEE